MDFILNQLHDLLVFLNQQENNTFYNYQINAQLVISLKDINETFFSSSVLGKNLKELKEILELLKSIIVHESLYKLSKKYRFTNKFI